MIGDPGKSSFASSANITGAGEIRVSEEVLCDGALPDILPRADDFTDGST